ncbi:ATP-binding protein [Aquabacterium sp. J223]|uniref:ATP-binding protein n=1 Tax=Aquabacterium sp. J223 TaxID=2898431 RepID=UPI0021ADCD2C|nr:ATP-binding protein [Aquabacterium sp. J223]UUX95641.1 ATP-binding protein [Aquabacterium sp. J223]
MQKNRPRAARRPLSPAAGTLEAALLAVHAPPTLQLSDDGRQVVAWHGDVEPFARPAAGRPLTDALQPGWRTVVSALLARVPQTGHDPSLQDDADGDGALRGEAQPVAADGRLVRPVLRRLDGLLLLSFEPAGRLATAGRRPVPAGGALLERLRWQQRLLQAASGVLAYLDRDGRYLWAGAAHARDLGLDAAQVIGRRLLDLVDPVQADRLRPALSGQPAAVSLDEAHAGLRLVPDLGADGTPRGWLVQGDAAASPTPAGGGRLRAEDAEAQLRLILESAADGLFGVDESGCVRFANPAACSQLGWSPDDLMGQSYSVLMRSADDGRALAEVLRDGVPAREDQAMFRHRDGHRVPVVYAARAMWRDERIVGAVVSFRDVSERLAVERAREAALAEAERLARARTEFLANMSHEIRTPLNAVLGLAEVAARGDRDRPAEETFRMILDSGQVLLHVVNDILDFSKMEAGKLRVESQLFELGQVVDRAVALVAPRVFAKGLAFRVDERPGLPLRLRGDPLRLTQVLGNLLANALKFTDTGAIQLVVRRDERDLWFSVSDTGIGIPPDRLSRLFKPFEQVDSSTTRRHGGTGLGLVISRHLMALMGGSIGVHSRAGQGSTFAARLPLVDAELPPRPVPGEMLVLAGLRDQPSLDHLAPTLRDLGFEVREVPAEAGAFALPSALAVVHTDALRDEPLRDAAAAALERGQRIAVLTHPVVAELPPALRGRVALIEQPVRARHLVAARVPPTQPPAAAPVEPVGRLAGLQLLAAEDNEVNALVLEAIMRMEGASLHLVENGRLAVQALQDHAPGHFQLVLTDIQMPEMDGYTAAREMLALDPALPIVGLTAHAMAEERERCLRAGMVDHLAKPIEVEPLIAAILKHARRT